jgi:hypothetical protein
LRLLHPAHQRARRPEAAAMSHVSMSAAPAWQDVVEIATFTKADGPLTKRIGLAPDGTLHSDGSACVMSAGSAQRMVFDDLTTFADHVAAMSPQEALALGALRDDLLDTVQIATKRALNGTEFRPDLIARTADYIMYRPDRPALVLIDIDAKGMPSAVRRRIEAIGGYWPALVSVLPELAKAGRVQRASTSAGLFRTDTEERLPGSDGRHVYIVLEDGADAERFLRRLHERCWLHGFGWRMVGAAGQLLDRSIVDRMVYAAERLVFEGAPVLDPPLAQDQAARAPRVTPGPALDSHACDDLNGAEQAQLRKYRAAEAHRLRRDVETARGHYIERLANRSGCTLDIARHRVERQLKGILLPNTVLPFDASELQGKTVGDVLAEPDLFIGETLSDPLEGEAYGRCKAIIMRRSDGGIWINSFAHGRSTYDLKHDATSIEGVLRRGEPKEAAAKYVQLMLIADLAPDEEQSLRELVCSLSGGKARPLAAKIKAAQQQQAQKRAEAERQRRAAERTDPRPEIDVPAADDPWLPQMTVLNDVLGKSSEPEPPMRDIDGVMTVVRVRRVPHMHTLTSSGTNDEEIEESRLPAPEQPLLTRLDVTQLGELIERYIDYIDQKGRSVHLPGSFVAHYLARHDHALPVVTAVATLPLMLPDGNLLSGQGLNRERGAIFRVPGVLEALLPCVEDCTPSAVAEAMRFLTDDWLCDVAANYAGKCILIAAALTILERLLLPERPAFFVTAGQRGGGKTTAANMIAVVVLGRRASAAAWSKDEEERRKAMLAYYGEGVPLIVWDNIPRGAVISCPSIEKALTAETYSDRVLGVSEYRTVPATGIHLFTGNNISPRGDLASRSLLAHFAVDRPDPENRSFRHPDPLGWTEAHRGQILRALYVIALGNPRLQNRNPPPAETRFKMWFHLIGSAIEHAAAQHAEHVKTLAMDADPAYTPTTISFRGLFLLGEAEEEQSSALATVLEVIRAKWPYGCRASEVAAHAGAAEEGAIEFRSALEQASGKALKVITATTVNWRLKALVDAPVTVDLGILVLRYMPDHDAGTFVVDEISATRRA